jgi:hypothetical protein
MRERFTKLLNAYSLLVARDRKSVAAHTARIRTLLKRFVELRELADASEQAEAADNHGRIRAILAGYRVTVDRYRRQQEQVADDFNLLDVKGRSLTAMARALWHGSSPNST